jgi:hypothetical protein
MYQELRQNFWWTRMKRKITKYVSECDACQRVKASNLKVAGTLQTLPIPSWKWEDISMDFIVGLPNTSQKHDSIWVIMDRLMKTEYFIPVHTTFAAKKYAEIYLDRIVCLHGVPQDNYFRSWCSIRSTFLGTLTSFSWHQTDLKLSCHTRFIRT